MDIKKQAVLEYLTLGFTYRQLASKYGVSRSTINTWVLVHQGIHDLPRSKRQNSYDLQQMKQGKKSFSQPSLPYYNTSQAMSQPAVLLKYKNSCGWTRRKV